VAVFPEYGRAVRASRHDPNVPDGASFEYPPKVNFALDAECGNINPIMADTQLPTSDQPS
jgi:hypothetical protein